MVDSDDEEEEEEGEDDFINDVGADLPEEDDSRRLRRPILMQEDQEDVDEIERRVKERYSKTNQVDYAEDATDVEQQALLPSVKDPKLWMVKCAIGHERETAICLMQKFMDRSDLQIKSVVALDHLKNYIYVEAEKEAHVLEACKGMRNIFSSAKVTLVPIKEMTDVLSVESKAVELARDTWVRMKIGIYKGDLAKVVDVDNVRQKVTVKLIPRVDLQALANKLEGREVVKKKTFVPPPRFFNIDEAREMHIRVERRRDKDSGEYFEMVDGLMFKEGFLYKTISVKSISLQNIDPTFDELEKFRKPGDDDGEVASLSTLFANRKKGHFMKGDSVIIIRGECKNLKGWVEKVEEDTVYAKLPELGTIAFNEKELCKYFKPGDHVKVVSGVQVGATGMVVKVESHVLIILSDTTKDHIRVFADHVVESSEITTGVTRVGDYELHDLVLLDNMSFGVIIRLETEAFQVLKGVADKPEVVLVKFREIKSKIERRTTAKDRSNNIIAIKDVVRVVEGPFSGKRGPNVDSLSSRLDALRSPSRFQSPNRLPPRGPPSECMHAADPISPSLKRQDIADAVGNGAATPFRFGSGRETPMHPSRTPMHPYQTPMRDPGGRDNWEDGNPATWRTSPQYHPGTPVRTYDAPTPGSGWANTPGGSYGDSATPRESSYGSAPSPYLPSTPTAQPLTPSSASYLPGTPGGQPMTPGNVGLDMMSPTIGGESEGNWLMPDILVNVVKAGGDFHVGVVKDVLMDGSCKVAVGSAGNGETMTVTPSDVEVIRPKKSDRIKIMNGVMRGATGKLIGVDGSDGIVKLDDTYEVKILDLVLLAKLAIV
ncbi:hypothetical protein ZIOFF_018513 [Zingiber officinale]|uniref:Transcription elongation factor SPT5 n=1 Tax=Zingiber officinale TaxID=94328 RepID=A0A8J5HCZ0_ZINOF|nr:hypothetical protein ZIOFF_018513 [Zingiber officinale]